jgi:hypothetical protein
MDQNGQNPPKNDSARKIFLSLLKELATVQELEWINHVVAIHPGQGYYLIQSVSRKRTHRLNVNVDPCQRKAKLQKHVSIAA